MSNTYKAGLRMGDERLREIQERRRSSAAGPQRRGNRRQNTRSAVRNAAIKEFGR